MGMVYASFMWPDLHCMIAKHRYFMILYVSERVARKCSGLGQAVCVVYTRTYLHTVHTYMPMDLLRTYVCMYVCMLLFI